MKKLIKVIASLLFVNSLFILKPIGACAEWKQDSNGWCNTEGSSQSIGWKEIDGKWYYFYDTGYMAHDTTVDGYTLGSDGSWIETAQNSSVNAKNAYVELEKLPQVYHTTQAQQNGDVVRLRGIQYNIEKLDSFIENYKNKKATIGDMVRIVDYENQGTIIIRDLILDSDGVKLKEDTTRAKYYPDDDKKITEYKVLDMYKKYLKDEYIKYYVKTDQSDEDILIYTSAMH